MEKTEDGNELNGDASSVVGADGIVTETSKVPFLMLGLDLPPPPLFKDAMEKNIIPQVHLPQVPMYYFFVIISCGCSSLMFIGVELYHDNVLLRFLGLMV
jgi:U4/U6.U5 tri-snRNP-associated protein 2